MDFSESRAERPLSPQEVASAAAKAIPDLNLATVYRNLKSMVADGRIAVVAMVGQPPRYEVAGLEHHHHFHCESCDRLYDISECGDQYSGLVPQGFEVKGHELQLSGVCSECAPTP